MNYPGGKNNCYQQIINLIPPHRVFIEAFAGSGAIARNIRPAEQTILLDLDADALAEVVAAGVIDGNGDAAGGHYLLKNMDCLSWMAGRNWRGDEFVYADPPYVMSSRSTQRKIYKHEYDDDDHIALLTLLKKLPCNVMISGYWSELYANLLSDWHTATFTAQTRNGPATEWLWMNYAEPVELHDYRYLGDNFRERERIKRKASRWVNRFDSLPLLERQAIVSQLQAHGVLKHR